MSPKAQRIEIAVACGIPKPGPCPCEQGCNCQIESLPDYPNDLNAMSEAEKTLPRYNNHDGCGTGTLDCYLARIGKTATAAQRAEAFLRTLSLWKTAQ